jgi:hypothetical protein
VEVTDPVAGTAVVNMATAVGMAAGVVVTAVVAATLEAEVTMGDTADTARRLPRT